MGKMEYLQNMPIAVLGGGAGGKEAADTCVATFEKRFSGAPVPSAELLLEALGEANSRVLARAEEKNFIGMATTVVAAALTLSGFFFT